MSSLLTEYKNLLQEPREKFKSENGFSQLKNLSSDEVHIFLIYFSCQGFHMTKSVSTWITRASARCKEEGYINLSGKLKMHAAEEDGHEQMMLADAKSLIASWNSTHDKKIDLDSIINIQSEAVKNYVELHEKVINERPFAQIAIELEIEMLSTIYVQDVIDISKSIVASTKESGLSFLEEHVALDHGHTRFNETQLSVFLGEHPELLSQLTTVGSLALSSYCDFTTECLKFSKTF